MTMGADDDGVTVQSTRETPAVGAREGRPRQEQEHEHEGEGAGAEITV